VNQLGGKPSLAIMLGIMFVFENFYCYQYTGEFGILDDYEPYRVFYRGARPGGGVNYCATLRG